MVRNNGKSADENGEVPSRLPIPGKSILGLSVPPAS